MFVLFSDDDDIVDLVGIAQFGTFPATFALVPLDNSPEETMEDAKQTTIKMKYLSDILFLLSMFRKVSVRINSSTSNA